MSNRSDLEKPLTRAWWADVGGLVFWQYPLVRGVPGAQRRTIDAILRNDRSSEWLEGKGDAWRAFGPLQGAAVTTIQAKACRLTAPLIGQALFSPLLALRAGASSATSIALCSETDHELEDVALDIARERRIRLEVVARRAAQTTAPFKLVPNLDALRQAYLGAPDLRRGHIYFDVPISARQSAHAAVFLDGNWRRGDQINGRRLTVLSQPGARGFGMYVLGEALIAREVARRTYPAAVVDCGVVVPRDDTVMRKIAEEFGVAIFLARAVEP